MQPGGRSIIDFWHSIQVWFLDQQHLPEISVRVVKLTGPDFKSLVAGNNQLAWLDSKNHASEEQPIR